MTQIREDFERWPGCWPSRPGTGRQELTGCGRRPAAPDRPDRGLHRRPGPLPPGPGGPGARSRAAAARRPAVRRGRRRRPPLAAALPHRALPGALRDRLPAAASPEGGWGSTPMQYLEKIFQIPFTLPPVDHAGYTAMVDALTAPAPRPDHSVPGPGAARRLPGDPRGGPGSPAAPARGTPREPAAAARRPGGGALRPARPHRRRAAPHRPAGTPAGHHPPVHQAAGEQLRAAQRHCGAASTTGPDRDPPTPGPAAPTTRTGPGSTLLGALIAFPDLSPAFFPRLLRPVPNPVPAAGRSSSSR